MAPMVWWWLAACSDYSISNMAPALQAPNPKALASPTHRDEIVQLTTPSADVLWVVDNSSSMSDNQRALTENFPLFLDWFLGSGLDYHIGVVSTDTQAPAHRGKLRASADGALWIGPDTDAPREAFAEMAGLGIGGSSDESGRDATWFALEQEQDGYNAGFLRDDPESGLHVILVSDENDHSSLVPKDEFIAWMNALRADPEIVTFNSICNPPGSGLMNEAGLHYIDYTTEVGGILQDIRAEDWVGVLDRLGIQVAGLKKEYFLSSLPVPESVAVEVELTDGTVLPMPSREWTYDASRNSVRFHAFVPSPLSTVRIDYTLLASLQDPDAFE
jgi:hypothetical protein